MRKFNMCDALYDSGYRKTLVLFSVSWYISSEFKSYIQKIIKRFVGKVKQTLKTFKKVNPSYGHMAQSNQFSVNDMLII